LLQSVHEHSKHEIMSRAVRYAIAGTFLSLGEPIGLLIVREILGDRRIPTELLLERATYLYVFVTTAVLLGYLGYLLGRQADRLEELSETDALTGLSNRRAFRRRLTEDLSRALRYGFPVSLLLIDVDGLKRINDTDGHAAGDCAIRRVADAIALTLREADLGARWGGDEFAIVMPNTSRPAARRSAERLTAQLADGDSSDSALPVTISIGLATFDPAATRANASIEELAREADEALYAAKRAGRNRIHAA
jgi:diguanylate cyclase (GGDEF)-like protein